ncbi:MAG: membrane protein insertase YidC [Actinomycetota bacterium]
MIGAYPWSPVWQGLLNGMGWLLARVYEVIPNWGVSIIVLTVVIRLLLLPLGIKQIRSMQHVQAIQPKLRALQLKYKGNRQKLNEETMKLYQEHGVNPFSGCWPMLLQLPILIAMYSVVRFPQSPVHIPTDSRLYEAVSRQIPEPTNGDRQVTLSDFPPGTKLMEGRYVVPAGTASGTDFLYMNLLCTAMDAGKSMPTVPSKYSVDDKPVVYQVDCGTAAASRVPYYVFAFLMFATTWYQQRQMTKANPPGATSQQQQAMLKVMPVVFGVFGFFFPAGLVLYWTTSNIWQIGQQYFMLRNRLTAEDLAARAGGVKKSGKRGFMASMAERAEEEQRGRSGTVRGGERKPGSARPGQRRPPRDKTGSGMEPDGGGPSDSTPGEGPPDGPERGGEGGPGSRKKRPKR